MSGATPLRERAEPALIAAGLLTAAATSTWRPLTGGVSSDLCLVSVAGQHICVVKGALETLRVTDHWHAPTSRNAVECAWLAAARDLCPTAAPRVFVHDPAQGFFAMEYFEPDRYPVWKGELLAGRVDPAAAAAVGSLIATLHVGTRAAEFAEQFATDDSFDALRLVPYFSATAARNPQVAKQLTSLRERTASTHLAVVHGDVSPKNILLGPDGPVLLDAECAWYGDPAFDVAFCVSHLFLKSVARPERAHALLASVITLVTSYFDRLDQDENPLGDRLELETRVATLVPALLLARVDGASPVEYLDAVQAQSVRTMARGLLVDPERTVRALTARIAQETEPFFR